MVMMAISQFEWGGYKALRMKKRQLSLSFFMKLPLSVILFES